MVIYSLSFYLSGKVYLYPGATFLGLFSLTALRILSHCFLFWRISSEKSADSLIRVPSYVMTLAAFKIFSLSLIFQSFFILSQWRSLWVESVWGSLNFMYLDGHLPRFWKLSAIISLHVLTLSLSFLSRTPIAWILFYLMLSHNSDRLSLLLFIFISFFFSEWIISRDFSSSSQILSSAWLNLLMKLSVAFFISLIVYFSSKMFLWFLLVELLIVLLHCFPNKFIVLSICVLLNLTALP